MWDEDMREIPAHMHDSLKRYVEYGVPPGGFLYAVLTNNLYEAVTRADTINQNWLVSWAHFMQWRMPHGSYGSREAVDKWIKDGGLVGRMPPPLRVVQDASEESEQEE